MELNYFRDRLFDLLNDSEGLSKNRRHRLFYRGTGWNRPDSPQGTKSP